MKINEDLIKNVINIDTSINDNSRVNFIHSKNLMHIKTIGSTTISGITFSISNDGTVTLNGTANATMQFEYLLEPLKSFAKEYYCLSYIYISGALTDGSVSVNNQDENHDWNGYNIELTKNNYSSNMGDLKSMQTDLNMKGAAIIRVRNGAVLNNLKFKLMFIKSRVRDYTYEPYVTPSINVDEDEIYSKPSYASVNGYTGQTITGATLKTIDNFLINNIATNGKPLCVQADFVAKTANAAHTAMVQLYVDNALKVSRLTTIISTNEMYYTFMIILDNIPAGTHKIEVKILGENTNTIISIPAWYTRHLNVWEIQ